MPRGRSACRTRPCDFWRSSAAYTSRRSQFVPLCVSEGRFVSSGQSFGLSVKSNPVLKGRPAAAGGQEGVDYGVLDIAVAEPVLHEAQIGSGLQQVGGDGVLEAVEVTLAGRHVSGLSVSSASRACAARSGRPD